MTLVRALAIETSGKSGSVALVEDAVTVVEESFSHGLQHAAGLLPMIDRLMRARGWNPPTLQHLYVSRGPGSFTGLRIGVTLAKTLSFATGARIVPVPTLRVLAMNAPATAEHIIVVLDAKRDQIFTARYQRQGSLLIEREPAHLDSLELMLSRAPRPVLLIGEGIPFHEKFQAANREQVMVTTEESWQARASIVAEIGIDLAMHGIFIDADRFVPEYVRLPEAEEKYLLTHAIT